LAYGLSNTGVAEKLQAAYIVGVLGLADLTGNMLNNLQLAPWAPRSQIFT